MRAVIPILSATLLLLAAPGPAKAAIDTQSIVDKTFDVVVLRPLGAFATVAGGVMSIPAALLAAPSGRRGFEETWNVFVEPPYESTFERPLGEF